MEGKMKKHLLKICVSSCAFFFALAIGCFAYFNNANHTYAYDIVISEGQQVNEVYAYGSSFTVPSASFDIDGQEIPATDYYVVYPNGVIYTSDTIKLTVEGEYKIVYSATVNGQKIKNESVKFKVYNNPWKHDYDSTTVVYEESLLHKPGTSGLHLTLSDGDMWTHNRVIDLSDNTGLEPVFEFSPWNCSTKVTKTNADGTVTNRMNDPEATDIFVRLTDCYDANNYINLRLHYYRLTATRYQTYITVTSPGVDSIGLREDGGKIIINNKAHSIYRNHPYSGAYSAGGFRSSHGAKLYYDNETKVISYYDGYQLLYITDLDNKDIYTNNMFRGFTTGEVYLSIYSELNNDAQTNYDIYAIDGVKGEALTETIVDDKAPVINVDIKDSLVRDGISIAKNEPFKIFDAEAYDVNLSGEISTIVYYNYGYENNICMTYNGVFTPKEIGSYAIVYSAVDAFGNATNKVIELTCVDKAKTIDLVLGEFASSYENAKVNKLPEFSFDTLNNLNNITLDITLEKDGKVYSVDPTANTFYLEDAGNYKVTYAYGDGIVSYTESYDINVVSSTNVSLDADKVAFPEYFIKGMKYTLETVKGYTYDTGKKVAHEPEFFVSNDGANFVKANMNDLLIEANETIRFKYSFTANGETAEYVTDSFKVVNNAFNASKQAFKERYLQHNYFVGDLTATQQSGAVMLAPNKLGTANIDFINVLSLEAFQFEFTVPQGYNNFASFEIKIIDFYDRDNVVTIAYRGNDTTSYVKINDSLEDTIKRPFVSSTAFRVVQSTGTKFTEASGITLDARQNFTSDKVLLHLSFTGVSGNAAVNVSKINGQQFTAFASDLPGNITVDTTYKGSYGLGETVKCMRAIAHDVMNPFYGKNFTVEVKYVSPEGFAEIVTDVNGKSLKFNNSWSFEEDSYSFVLSKIGSYRVTYNYTDQGNKAVSAVNLIQVGDTEPPKFQIKKEGQTLDKNTVINVKLNDTYEFPGIQATDNVTPTNQMTIRIVVMRPDTTMFNVTTGSYKFLDRGMHRISYMVFDGSGNYSLDYFCINVQ